MSTTKAMKFRIKDEEHSKAIQEKLFSLGLKWGSYNVGDIYFEDKPYLFTDDWYITYDSGPDSDYFEDHEHEEYVLLDGEFVPASSLGSVVSANVEVTASGETVEGSVISDGGSSQYYKLTITNKAGVTIEAEVGDVIRCMVGDNHSLGNIIKACRRMYEASNGRGKAGTSMEYDSNKIAYFATEYAHFYGGTK